MVEDKSIRRGQIWYISFNDAYGSEEAVGRPAIVVSSNEGIDVRKVLHVVYLTTQAKKGNLAVEINSTNRLSYAMCYQITSVDRTRFLKYMCDASVREMVAVDIAIKKVLFSQHGVESGVDELAKIEEEKNKLELELEITKKMYERVLNLLVEERVVRDMKNASVSEPEVVISEPIEVDVELLKAQMSTPNDQEISPVEFKAKKRNPQYETKAAAQLKERMDAAKRKMVGKKANINTATAEELMGAAGMGIGMARTIVKRRRDFGPYKDVSDLLDIHQLSDKMFVKYEPFLEV